jgi:TrmH family RNA methyltransferase
MKGVLPTTDIQSSVHVVLVEPAQSLNIGSVARAMSNLGFAHLHLVNPVDYQPRKAAVTACWGEQVLHDAQVHESLEEALAPMREVIGFSARRAETKAPPMLIGEWVETLAEEFPRPIALVFGPEDTGLRHEHVELCGKLVRIPTASKNPAFNLSQAVLIALYELSRTVWSEVESGPERVLPEWHQFTQLDRLIERVLTAARFFHKDTPAPIPALVKQLVRRMRPDEREMRVLLGIFGRIDKTFSSIESE